MSHDDIPKTGEPASNEPDTNAPTAPAHSSPPMGTRAPATSSRPPLRSSKPPNVFGAADPLPTPAPPRSPEPTQSKPPTRSTPPRGNKPTSSAPPRQKPSVNPALGNIFQASSEPEIAPPQAATSAVSALEQIATVLSAPAVSRPEDVAVSPAVPEPMAAEIPAGVSALDVAVVSEVAAATAVPAVPAIPVGPAVPALPVGPGGPLVAAFAEPAPASVEPVAPAVIAPQAAMPSPNFAAQQPLLGTAAPQPYATPQPAVALAPTTKPKLWSPALTIFGASFWAYLVLGELVVTFDFPEQLAWLLLVVVFGLQCRTATAAGTYPSTLRRATRGLLAFGLLLFSLSVTVTLLGTNGRSRVAAVTLLLWFFAVAMYSIGRVLGRPRTGEIAAVPWAPRWLRIGTWIVCIGASALAVLATMDAQ